MGEGTLMSDSTLRIRVNVVYRLKLMRLNGSAGEVDCSRFWILCAETGV